MQIKRGISVAAIVSLLMCVFVSPSAAKRRPAVKGTDKKSAQTAKKQTAKRAAALDREIAAFKKKVRQGGLNKRDKRKLEALEQQRNKVNSISSQPQSRSSNKQRRSSHNRNSRGRQTEQVVKKEFLRPSLYTPPAQLIIATSGEVKIVTTASSPTKSIGYTCTLWKDNTIIQIHFDDTNFPSAAEWVALERYMNDPMFWWIRLDPQIAMGTIRMVVSPTKDLISQRSLAVEKVLAGWQSQNNSNFRFVNNGCKQ
jgi:hypothetical protein